MDNERKALQSLQRFVREVANSGVADKEQFRAWRKAHERRMETLFWYERGPAMPAVTSLVGMFFHPQRPLIGLNYTPVAHNTLFGHAGGWTAPLRLCRGIVFDREGRLVAKPFPKFFNAGEHEETRNLPQEPFVATRKHDGHLGIIFEYGGGLFFTTRGDFESRTSLLGSRKLAKYAANPSWRKRFPGNLTVLVEFIDPKTRVYLDYGRKSRFMLIGAYDRETLCDHDHNALEALGKRLGWPVTERWSGSSIDDLKAFMADRAVENQEGYVVRFSGGLRVKFKFATYIARMVADKLSYRYLMQRMLAGNLEKMLSTLPEETLAEARSMVGRLQSVTTLAENEKTRREYLYVLAPEKERTDYYRTVCRKFLVSTAKTAGRP